VQLGIDSSNPTSLTPELDFKDIWDIAAGAQYRISPPWLLNFGVGYGLQRSRRVLCFGEQATHPLRLH
jgi:long-subunit fatty acid transport protein